MPSNLSSDDPIDYFTVVCLVSQPLSEHEAEVDLVHFDNKPLASSYGIFT